MPQAPRLPARKPRTVQHQGWGGSPQRQDGATSGLERRNPKNGTSQCQGWSGATQKTKSRDIRAGAAQPKNGAAQRRVRSNVTPWTGRRNLHGARYLSKPEINVPADGSAIRTEQYAGRRHRPHGLAKAAAAETSPRISIPYGRRYYPQRSGNSLIIRVAGEKTAADASGPTLYPNGSNGNSTVDFLRPLFGNKKNSVIFAPTTGD